MSVVLVRRPPRATPPAVPSGRIVLNRPVPLPPATGRGRPAWLLPLLATAGAGALLLMPGTPPFTKGVGAVMLGAALATGAVWSARTGRVPSPPPHQARRDYFDHLAAIRARARAAAREQRDAQVYLHPPPGQLWAVVADPARLWERRAGDTDFAVVRLGVGPRPPAVPVVTAPAAEEAHPTEPDPLTGAAARRLLAAHATVEQVPAAIALRAFRQVVVSGDPEAVHGAVRAMLAQVAVLHAPRDVLIAVAVGRDAVTRWEWTKWLPHTESPGGDGARDVRLIRSDPVELAALLGGMAARPGWRAEDGAGRPHLVVLVDGAPSGSADLLASAWGSPGVTVIEAEPGGRAEVPADGLAVRVGPGHLLLRAGAGPGYQGSPDHLSLVEAEALARRLAPLRSAPESDGLTG